MSARPGALQPWPVEQFYPELAAAKRDEGNTSLKTPIRGLKRTLSPADAPFSPTKRRLLNEAGVYLPAKTPIRGRTTPFLGTPARKLEFAQPVTVQTPGSIHSLSVSLSSTILAPSLGPSIAGGEERTAFTSSAPLPGREHDTMDHYPAFVVYEDLPSLSPPPAQPRFSKQDHKENRRPSPRPEPSMPADMILSPDPKTAELQKKMFGMVETPKASPVKEPKTAHRATVSLAPASPPSFRQLPGSSPLAAGGPSTPAPRHVLRSHTKSQSGQNLWNAPAPY
ncbi:hypothetical protein CYLTODRAFT_194889 [Cylindrobasidium torrendii FP15055 ss-10]|uniref:Uncharacterized protein n=1 Tax=Cylindrobasidium torrendii FP15055 ss-10 TaxID=1314674 RepID=A0A0D7BU94_9AGAR|nr:hypothetical protein CYLTODRAFT_194889 [Cylindrobasidium torrendii FP15055 ss-10]